MTKRFIRQNGESMQVFQMRIAAVQSVERQAREALNYRSKRVRQQSNALRSASREADRIDGYDRDDLGLSSDY